MFSIRNLRSQVDGISPAQEIDVIVADDNWRRFKVGETLQISGRSWVVIGFNAANQVCASPYGNPNGVHSAWFDAEVLT